jgi:hypothetical protein
MKIIPVDYSEISSLLSIGGYKYIYCFRWPDRFLLKTEPGVVL